MTALNPVAPYELRRYPRPQLALLRFVARGMSRTSAVWGIVLAFYVYASSAGFTALAPTAAGREALLESLGANTGIKALLGDGGAITTVGGFVDWRVLGVMPLLTSVWALLASTKAMRGEEAAGRWEPFLAAQTTSRRATANCLGGMAVGLVVLWALVAMAVYAIGVGQGLGYTVGGSVLFATASIASVAVFMAVGALASQLMPTRARAAALSAGAFGVAFMLRALGDAATSVHWLVYLSPLGWIEQIRPLTDAHGGWLLPVGALVALLVAGSLALSDRDLGDSIVADHDSAAAKTRLLSRPGLLAFRLSRATITGWLVVVVVVGVLYGSIAKSAGQTFASSSLLRKIGGALTGSAQHLGTQSYTGIIFLMTMTLLMAYAASAASNAREQESQGYLDNLVVRSVSRSRWLAAQALLAMAVVVAAGLLFGLAFWGGQASQHSGLTLGELLQAGVNAMAPPVLLLGIAVFVFGFWPRATAVAGYAVVAWAFLLQMLGSAVSINHWIMDSSLLNHVTLAPAVSPNWRVVATYVVLGLALMLLGGWRFTVRDLKTE